MKIYVNGSLVSEADAVLPVSDHGLTVGDGLFETMKVVDGVAFAIGRHLARLRRTASGLGLRVPSDDELRDAIESTVAANGPEVGRVRMTVTGGSGPAGTSRGNGPPTVLVQCAPATVWPQSSKVVTVPWPRNERGVLAGLKTTSYADNVIAFEYAEARGGDEAVFANTQDNLCEGTGTNVFVVIDDRLVTPPLTAGCLAGRHARAPCSRSTRASTRSTFRWRPSLTSRKHSSRRARAMCSRSGRSTGARSHGAVAR